MSLFLVRCWLGDWKKSWIVLHTDTETALNAAKNLFRAPHPNCSWCVDLLEPEEFYPINLTK